MGKRALLIVLYVLGAVPVATGLLGIIAGPAGAPGGAPTVASVDSEYRFVNTFWLAAGLILWWSLRRASDRALITRVMLTLAALGGIPRVLSWIMVGPPHPVFIGTLVLELVIVPLVILWHSRVFPVARAPYRSVA
jgi:hypothetical protein